MEIEYKFYKNVIDLPDSWQEFSRKNIFFSIEYLNALENSAPKNIQLFYGCVFENEILIGIFLIQISKIKFQESFRYKEDNILNKLKKIVNIFFRFDVFVLGNLMISGQNAWIFNNVDIKKKSKIIENLYSNFSSKYNKKFGLKIIKDEQKNHNLKFNNKLYYEIEVQPMMVMDISKIISFENYLNLINTKYRTRYKNAISRINDVIKKELNEDLILKYDKTIFKLYLNVSNNAEFNTFILSKNHFYQLKKNLKDKFRLFGYFLNDELISFYTIIENNNELETYFLGYSTEYQKAKQLYLNMLYDMLKYGIDNNFEKINYGRTAIEIKSTVGAKPEELVAWIAHKNFFVNKFMPNLFELFNPKNNFIIRNPFK